MFGGKVIILQQCHPHFIFDKTRSLKNFGLEIPSFLTFSSMVQDKLELDG
jgi:hypothetical protein